MRRLPDDFNVNILLPGAVWLLISVLIGRVSASRLETDAITVVLFVVISLVVFTIPMAVYMEYRNVRGNLARCLHCSDGGLYGVPQEDRAIVGAQI